MNYQVTEPESDAESKTFWTFVPDAVECRVRLGTDFKMLRLHMPRKKEYVHHSLAGDGQIMFKSVFRVEPLLFRAAGSLRPLARSEARRVGKECVSTCRSRCAP